MVVKATISLLAATALVIAIAWVVGSYVLRDVRQLVRSSQTGAIRLAAKSKTVYRSSDARGFRRVQWRLRLRMLFYALALLPLALMLIGIVIGAVGSP